MTSLPNYFQDPGSQIPATYQYIDIIEGTGIAEFDLGVAQNSSSTYENFITTADTPSEYTSYTATCNNATKTTTVLDLDFDLPLNFAKTIKGIVRITGTIGHKGAAGSLSSTNVHIVALLRRWDGSTETELASITSKTYPESTFISSTTAVNRYFTLDIDASTGYNFSPTETIRITLQLYNEDSGTDQSNGSYNGFGTDPANRTDTQNNQVPGTAIIDSSHNTNLKAYIPFLLNLQ